MHIKERKKLSWKPVRRGGTYCSPACGAECKYTDYLEAKAEASALAEVMGRGWKARVWENMGWFYEVVNRMASVRKDPRGEKYLAGITFGRQFWAQDICPRNAFKRVLAQSDVELAAWSKARATIGILEAA